MYQQKCLKSTQWTFHVGPCHHGIAPPRDEATEDGLQICPCALTEHHAMKAYWRSGGIAPLILRPR
jgi:hypothetical protein